MPLGYGGNTMGNGGGGGNQLQGIVDPRLQQGGPYHMVGLGGGIVLAVTPEGYEAIRASIANDMSGGEGGGVNWNSVNWNSVNWNSVNWNSVNWNSVNWNSVNWNSVNWNSVNWNSVNWNS